MNEEYLTIKEFAKLAGVSQQNIYKQVNGRLKPYIKKVDSRTVINSSALNKFYKTEHPSSTDIQPSSTDIQPENNLNTTDSIDNSTEKVDNSTDSSTDIQPDLNDEKEPIDRIIDLLQKELEEKNKQLAIKDKQIEELNNRLAEVIQLNKGQIYISAAEKTTGLLEADNKPEPQPEKKSFWKRLFGK